MAKSSFVVIFVLSFCFAVSGALPSKLFHGKERLSTRTNSSYLHFPWNMRARRMLVSDHQAQLPALEGNSHPPLDKELPGIYISMENIAHSLPLPIGFDMDNCPSLVEIVNVTSVSGEGPNVYQLEYESGLRVDNQSCFALPGAATALKLYPTSTNPESDNETSFAIWVGLIPEGTVQCGPEPAPQVSLSILPVEALLTSFSIPPAMMSMENGMKMPSNFSLVVSVGSSICPYFTESNIELVTTLIQKQFNGSSGLSPAKLGDAPGSPAMDPDSILHSHFELRQLCPCTPYFPKTVSFLPTSEIDVDSELKLNSRQNMIRVTVAQNSEEEAYDAHYEEGTHMPMPVKWNGSLCPSKRIYTIGEVVSFEDNVMNDTGFIKRLMLHGVVEKLFDEIRDEITANKSPKIPFEEKRSLLMKFGVGLEGMRGVIPFLRGSKCGGQSITRDFVMLLEVYHILHQLSNSIKRFVDDFAKWEEILHDETLSVESGTLHMFAMHDSHDLDVCTYTASLRARELLADKCASFVPLGRRDRKKIPTQVDETNSSPEPTTGNEGNSDDGSQGRGNGNHSEDDRNKTSTLSPMPSFDGSIDSNREGFEPQGEGTVQTVSPSATPSIAYPTPSASAVASKTASPSVSPEATVDPSPSSSPSASWARAAPSISVTPPPSSLASPSPSPSLNSTETDDSESACFPGSAKVILEDRSLIYMRELRVGDNIIDGSGETSRVLTFAHSNPEVKSFFVLIKFEGGQLPISAQHYLPTNGKLATAESVKVGDFINVFQSDQSHNASSRPAKVLGVERISLMGLFNPQTDSGSIAVIWKGNAVVASTYTRAVDPAFAHIMMWPLRGLDRVAGIVIPMIANALRDGSIFWKRLLPEGNARI